MPPSDFASAFSASSVTGVDESLLQQEVNRQKTRHGSNLLISTGEKLVSCTGKLPTGFSKMASTTAKMQLRRECPTRQLTRHQLAHVFQLDALFASAADV